MDRIPLSFRNHFNSINGINEENEKEEKKRRYQKEKEKENKCCGAPEIKTIQYEVVCVNCGTVHAEDYVDRSTITDETFYASTLYDPMTIHSGEKDATTDLSIQIWPECPESVIKCANDLFHDFSKFNNTIYKGQKREMTVVACLYNAQMQMNLGIKTKQWFQKWATDAHTFNTMCTEVQEFVEGHAGWKSLLERPKGRLHDDIDDILAELEIPKDRRIEVRRRAFKIDDLIRSSSVKVKSKFEGIKDKNMNTAIVVIACQYLRIAIKDHGLAKSTFSRFKDGLAKAVAKDH